jgi:hypothetical protein
MANPKTSTTEATRRFRQLLAFALLCAALVAAIAIPSAGAVNAKVIGKTKSTPKPSCPKNCSAVGKVTGFMTKADGRKRPFKVRKDGKIVAWAINLGRPRNTEKNPDRKFFGNLFKNEEFGKHPSGRIAILRKKKGSNYKLVKQSPALDLNSEMGRKQIFTLNKPLRVHPGQIVAFTYPTYAPNFASPVSDKGNHWRASRKRGKCNTDSEHIRNVKDSRPHQKLGAVRNYECRYEGARLLYWAYFVPNKKG